MIAEPPHAVFTNSFSTYILYLVFIQLKIWLLFTNLYCHFYRSEELLASLDFKNLVYHSL